MNAHEDENIAYNSYNYDGLSGGAASWGSNSFAFPQGGTGTFTADAGTAGLGLFANATQYQIEDNWAYVDRVAAVVDDRISGVRGDLHIVFSGGPSYDETYRTQSLNPANHANGAGGEATRLYYSRFNNNEWELPQVVATASNGAF